MYSCMFQNKAPVGSSRNMTWSISEDNTKNLFRKNLLKHEVTNLRLPTPLTFLILYSFLIVSDNTETLNWSLHHFNSGEYQILCGIS